MNSDIEKLIIPLKQQAQEYFRQWAKNGEASLGQRISHIAASLESMSLDLEERSEEELARSVRATAQLLENLSDKVQTEDPEDLWHSIEEHSLQNPVAAFLVSMAAGFVSGRVTKHAVSQKERTRTEVNSSEDDFVDPEFFTAEDIVGGMDHESMLGASAPSVGATVPPSKRTEHGGDQWQK